HYSRAVIALADLGVNQSRGALLGIALVAGARGVVAVEPGSGRVTRRLGRPAMAADALRFAIFHAAAFAAAPVASLAIDALARVAGPQSAQLEPRSEGRVVYLRTDVELRLSPLRAGGSLAHTLGILRALRRRGHEVEIWTTGEVSTAAREGKERRLPVVMKGNVPREFCELLSGLAQGLRPLPLSSPPEFIYQRHSMNNLAGVLLARRWKVPLVLEANASEVQWREEWSSLRLPALGRACERLILGDAARVAAVSDNAARHLLAAGAPPDRLRVVPNGVETERFAGATPRELPFDRESFVIGFIGLFYPWHGVRHLAEAFPLILEACPNARLLLVGDGEDAAVVRRLLEGSGAIDRVLLPGLVPADDVPGYLLACDVLASPHAASEGFIGSPIKIWEYMASGRAIIASALAQLGDVLEDERTALLVPPGDPVALAAAIIRLHGDPALRDRLGQSALEEAMAKHSWDARLRDALE
ncbi:MAG TPA: glycosyltransferase family 4 protein, partial [Solirubrobacterales bacterium]